VDFYCPSSPSFPKRGLGKILIPLQSPSVKGVIGEGGFMKGRIGGKIYKRGKIGGSTKG